MNVLVLGGCGIQGKTALFDLSGREWVSTIVVADLFPDSIRDLTYVDQSKTRLEKMDLTDQ
jgi:saccharopine dehydrogenase-like NADP-dependent oxidoreductase